MEEYYVEVNPGSPGRREFETLGPYTTEAEATLVLVKWLNKNFPMGWSSNSNGQYMPDVECLAGYIAGMVREEGIPVRLTGMEPALGSIMYERERQYQEYREAVEELKEAIAETFYPALDIAVKVANWLGIK